MSRDISKLTDSMQKKFGEFQNKMKIWGIPFMVTSVDRSILEQMALYVQGRLTLLEVNRFRIMSKMSPITEEENKKVTWTLNSKHVTNMFDEDLNNDRSRAFDIAIIRDGKPVWDLKINVNENDLPDYEEAAVLARECGLKAGIDFNDPCHFEEVD